MRLSNSRHKFHRFSEPISESEAIRLYGPFECPRCGQPFNDKVAYCTNCGKVTTIFTSEIWGQCTIHPNRVATDVCCLCKRGVCDLCYKDAPKKDSAYECVQCRQRCAELEDVYLKKLEQSGTCAKHPDRKRIGVCKSCGLPVCEQCGYLWWKGIFSPKVTDGPFCDSCDVALVSRGHKGKRCISFQEAIARGFDVPNSIYDTQQGISHR